MNLIEKLFENLLLIPFKELISTIFKLLFSNNSKAKKGLCYLLLSVILIIITVSSAYLIFFPPTKDGSTTTTETTETTEVTEQADLSPYDNYCKLLSQTRDEITSKYKTNVCGVTNYSEKSMTEIGELIKKKEKTKDAKERIDICEMILIKESNHIGLIKELADSYLDYGIYLYQEKNYSESKNNLLKSVDYFNRLIEFSDCKFGLSDILYRIGQAYEHMSLLYPKEKSFEKDGLQNSIVSLVYYSIAAEKVASGQVYSDYCHFYSGNMLLKIGKRLLISNKDKRWFIDALNMYTDALLYTQHTSSYERCVSELRETNDILNNNFTIK